MHLSDSKLHSVSCVSRCQVDSEVVCIVYVPHLRMKAQMKMAFMLSFLCLNGISAASGVTALSRRVN